MRDRAPITEPPIEGGATDDVIVLGDCAEPRGGMHQCTAGGDSLEVAPITSEATPVVEKETVGRATRPAVAPLSGRAASPPPAAPHAPDERWQLIGGGLGFQLTCDCLSPTFLVVCGDDDSLTMQCKACHGTSLVLTVWEEAREFAS